VQKANRPNGFHVRAVEQC